jgi:hypothetical protein
LGGHGGKSRWNRFAPRAGDRWHEETIMVFLPIATGVFTILFHRPTVRAENVKSVRYPTGLDSFSG